MEYVHHCVFCGWSRSAKSATLLAPACEACGCTLRADSASDYVHVDAVDAGTYVAPSRHRDVTAAFAALVAIPMVLPLAGVDLGDITFAAPMVLLLFASLRCVAAVRRDGKRRGMWATCAVGAALASAASGLVVATSVLGVSSRPAFYLGAGGSIGLLIAMGQFAARSLARARMERIVDAVLFALVVVAFSVAFVAVPGLGRGGPVLTSIFLVDTVATLAAAVAALARVGSRHRRTAWVLLGVCFAAMTGDGVMALGGGGGVGGLAVAVAWSLAGYGLAVAADGDVARRDDRVDVEWSTGARWFMSRIALPLAAVLAFPAVVFAMWSTGTLSTRAIVFFSIFFVLELVFVFGRQAWLLVENRRSVSIERALRAEAMRRNEELEALTGLATTMTQTLEEAPIVEQALGVLHLAARATSSALHTEGPAGPELQAVPATGRKRRPGRPASALPRDDTRCASAAGARSCASCSARAASASATSRCSGAARTPSTPASSIFWVCWWTSSRSRCRTPATTARSSSRPSATR
jgi:hypothetical protein